MTSKLTITRERLQEIAEDGFLKHGESKILARMALAAMDSEPVAWTDEEELRDANAGACGYLFGIDCSANKFADPRRQIMLYRHAQSAPDRDQVRREHAEWSQATFGDVGPVGPLKHLSKEALEAAAEPGDLSEWADMQFLLWDAQRRAGITDEQITLAMIEKLAVNKQREWPEPKDGEPRLHIKEQPAPVVMDDRKLRSLFDSWFASDCSFDLSPEASEADNIAWRESYWYVWQRCRAAMLQAGTITNEGTKQAWTGIPDIDNAINMLDRIDTLESCDDDRVEAVKTVLRRLAGNSPVIPDSSASMLRRWLVFGRGMQNAGSQLPHNLIAETEEMLAAAHCIIPMISDRWVPVSERVPTKQDGSVFLTWNGQYIGKELFLMGSFQCLKPEIITHWMPLPAAPQEVKSES